MRVTQRNKMVLGYLKDVLKFTKNYFFCQVVILLYRNNNSHLLIDVINEDRTSSLPSLPPKLNLTAILCLGRENKWASYSFMENR